MSEEEAPQYTYVRHRAREHYRGWKMPLGVMFGLEGPWVRLCGNDSKTVMSSLGDTGCPSSQSENRDAYGHLGGL